MSTNKSTAWDDNSQSSTIVTPNHNVQPIILSMVHYVLLSFNVPVFAFHSIVRLLSIKFSITLSFSTILIILALIVGICFIIVRYKYLTKYSKSTKEKDGKPSRKKELEFMDGLKRGKKQSSKAKNYLDEFLSAIKVFGYLERPVFHELTKNMTTQRLEEDEILYLEESLGFSVVVEGTVQVYTKINEAFNLGQKEREDDELNFEKGDLLIIGNQRYQLLNEVKSGAPLTSLMSTLDLFSNGNLASSSSFDLDYDVSNLSPHSRRGTVPNISPFEKILKEEDLASEQLSPSIMSPIYPDIVARPKADGGTKAATIAIIPSLAFQRVHSKFPKKTSHIVTMVLTRLYKVTFKTIHDYLGLTREIIESEVRLNDNDGKDNLLPSYLYDGVVEKFYGKNKISSLNNNGEDKSLVLTSSNKSEHSIRNLNSRSASSRYVVLNSRSKPTHPGDLLSSVPLSRKSDYYQTHSLSNNDEDFSSIRPKLDSSSSTKQQSQILLNRTTSHSNNFDNIRRRTFSDAREETEETSLRIALVEKIFKLLGINEESTHRSNFSNLNSGASSLNSSTIGLSSLTKEFDGKHNPSEYDSNTRRLDPHDSLCLSLQMDSINNKKFKFYNTIHQSELPLISKESESPIQEINITQNVGAAANIKDNVHQEPSFNILKDEFSKVLDIKFYPPDCTIVKQKSVSSGLFYVIDGTLEVSYTNQSSSSLPKKLYSIKPGGIAGYLSTIVGFGSLVTIKTPLKKGSIVAHIPKSQFSKLMDKYYFLQLQVALKLKKLLSKQIITIDYALEWCHIPAGSVLCSQGDLANGFHIVLSGRFRVIKYSDKKMKSESSKNESDSIGFEAKVEDSFDFDFARIKEGYDYEILGEYGHGESIGEVEVLTASRRTNSLIAVRDSETARIPRTLFEILSLQSPSIMVKVSRIVASKLIENENIRSTSTSMMPISSVSLPNISNSYKTITILPTVTGLPVRDFADKLVTALKSIGRKVIALDQASTLTHLGRHAFNERLAHLKLSGYFAYLEEEYETIVYVCDTQLKSSWTSTCISQGDCILLLADADDIDTATNFGDYERLLINLKTTARTDICLIHSEKYVEPGSTSVWLKHRNWVQGHHHIQMDIPRDSNERNGKGSIIKDIAAKIGSKANPNIKLRFENVTSRAILRLTKINERLRKRQSSYKSEQSHKNDFLRLARILSNEAVGLVLGGGGSRGISHLGVVMALERQGIPVDLIGGTSIGSFIGGLYAKDYNTVYIYGKAKKFSKRISSLWRSLFDLTYPVTSYITGFEFNRGIWKAFGSSEIEDFWIKFFCNSTNITNSTMDIHETGFSWRFIRASMSLAGLLPPIAHNGCMLLDGGYLDNLPVMEMKKKGAKYIIAVDVGSADDRTPMNYGDTLSGFWVLFNRWNPLSKHPNVPSMTDIQMRLAYVASVNALEIARRTPGVLYLRPPIDNYATLDFAKFDEIFHVGMAYADDLFISWRKSGKLPPIAGMVDKTKINNEDQSRYLYRRNSI